MGRLVPAVGLLWVTLGATAEAGMLAIVVADAPYQRVWEAAVRAVDGYPVTRAADGVIVTDWVERPPHQGEVGYTRVLERLTLRVESASRLITRVTVDVEARGRRDGDWVPLQDTEPAERAVLDRIRPGQG